MIRPKSHDHFHHVLDQENGYPSFPHLADQLTASAVSAA
jgi:hypothetical protein